LLSQLDSKPEQIRILEAIFISGTVNPPEKKSKPSEQFGDIQGEKVYYWFQNRKYKTKRRQRQLDEKIYFWYCQFPREEIKTIRAQLQQFGYVHYENVYYWFQNRKYKTK